MSNATETDPAPESTPPARGRFLTRSKIIIAAVGVFVLAIAAFGIPAIVNQTKVNNATEAHSSSRQAVDAAFQGVLDAQEALSEAGSSAVSVYTDTTGFIKIVRTNLLSDPKTVESLKAANEDLKAVAGLTLDKKGAATAPEPEEHTAPTLAPVAAEYEEILAQVDVNNATATSYGQMAEDIQSNVDKVAEKIAKVDELTSAVLTSGAKFGADLKPFPKADAALLKTLGTKVAELTGEAGTPTERFNAYAAAYDAVAKSQADKVAAEKAEAERIAQEKAGTEGDQSGSGQETSSGNDENYSGGNDNNGGSGSDNKTTGGGEQPKPQPKPQPEPEPQPQPEPKPEPQPEQPSDPGPRGNVNRGAGSCVADGGSAWASWGSSISIPADAADYTVWEEYGVKWGVNWVCVTEW